MYLGKKLPDRRRRARIIVLVIALCVASFAILKTNWPKAGRPHATAPSKSGGKKGDVKAGVKSSTAPLLEPGGVHGKTHPKEQPKIEDSDDDDDAAIEDAAPEADSTRAVAREAIEIPEAPREAAEERGVSEDEEEEVSPPPAVAVKSTTAASNSSAKDPTLQRDLRLLGECTELHCVKKYASRLVGRTKFNFPHFFLIGWQKTATTSVAKYFRFHPQFLVGEAKESHWFTSCKQGPSHGGCRCTDVDHYLKGFLRLQEAVEQNLEVVAADYSADYAWKGEALAKELAELFPWLKIVILLREPISRLISYTRMHTQRGNEFRGCLNETGFKCIHDRLDQSIYGAKLADTVYADALEAWLDHFPAEQIRVIQFEELQVNASQVLTDLKKFIGVDVDLPRRAFGNANSRRKSGGYEMSLKEYNSLIDSVRPRARRVARMLGEKGLAVEEEWMGRWQAVWQRVREEDCDTHGKCTVNSN